MGFSCNAQPQGQECFEVAEFGTLPKTNPKFSLTLSFSHPNRLRVLNVNGVECLGGRGRGGAEQKDPFPTEPGRPRPGKEVG